MTLITAAVLIALLALFVGYIFGWHDCTTWHEKEEPQQTTHKIEA